MSSDTLAMRLLSVADVAEATGLSETAVYRAIAVGELRASKLRGRLRVRLADLESWIDSNRVSPAEEPRIKARARGRVAMSGSRGLRELLRQES